MSTRYNTVVFFAKRKSKPLTAQTNNTITSMTHRRRTQQNRRARNRAARLHNDAFAAAFNNLDAEAEAAAEGNLQAEQGAEGPGAAELLQPAPPPQQQDPGPAAGAGFVPVVLELGNCGWRVCILLPCVDMEPVLSCEEYFIHLVPGHVLDDV
jgi:hypothetical protein